MESEDLAGKADAGDTDSPRMESEDLAGKADAGDTNTKRKKKGNQSSAKVKKRKRQPDEGQPPSKGAPLLAPGMDLSDSEEQAQAEASSHTPGKTNGTPLDVRTSDGGEKWEQGGDQKKEAKKSKHTGGKAQPILPWMRVPVEIEDGGGVPLGMVHGLHPSLIAALQKRGYKELFPVQAASWRTLAGGMSQAHDLCICAPTGSGKTLAYALPVLQSLVGIVRGMLGALVVLPTRELAVQVYDVFAALSPRLGLWTALTAARVSQAAEAAALGEAPPNVLVATPGRLMSHLKDVRLSLSDLRFLVVDETDRLLRQAYQDWLPHVVSATAGHGEPHPSQPQGTRVVKILVSATLTQDPSKMERLRLFSPRYISMSASDHRYKVPKQLKEYKLVGASIDKPVLLLALLRQLKSARTIVFTASLPATNRLYLLLHELLGDEVIQHSSISTVGRQTAEARKEATGLAAFRGGRGSVLVASDAATRGMDVPGVEVVINYDAATYPKTYIHRAGRTARAGKEGTVVSLLSTEQVHHFKSMLRKVDNTFVKDYPIPPGLVATLRSEVKEAMERAAGREDEGK